MKKSFFLLLLVGISSFAIAQGNGIFPPEPFNGMQANYTITGATISKYTDAPGYTWTRSLVITDLQRGGTLGISGTLQAGGYGCTVVVSVQAGNGKPSTHTYEVKPGTPMNFSEQVSIPRDAKTASVSIDMNGHYSMGGGSRGVIIRGSWDEKWGSENLPPTPDRFKPQPSPVAILKNILRIYSDESKIPRGLVSNGPDNNKLWWFDKKYDDYTCGAYQSKVLSLLDNMKFGSDPKQRELLRDYEYGPIQANCGITPGGHHAVVIFPKGTDWRETGTVLDPWPEQKPKSYTIQEWMQLFPSGVNPDGYYRGQYPLTGGSDYSNPRRTELTPAETNWYKSLPRGRQDTYAQIRDLTERKRRMKIDYANRNNDTRVLADCPLNLYVIDRQGRMSGFPGGRLHTEIPGVSVNTFQLTDGTYWTELAYPGNRGYRVMMEGSGRGTANIYSGFNMQGDPDERSVYKYDFPVNERREYSLDQAQENIPIEIVNAPQNRNNTINAIRVSPERNDRHRNAPSEVKIFDNGNIYGVNNGPRSATQFTLTNSCVIIRIENYHYFNRGRVPGTISLIDARGRQYGPWQATGTEGQGGVPNAYWEVRPNISLPPGTYTVIDSDPSTWSANAESGYQGFARVWIAGRTF